jgi:riboflavin kinase/FMN adenylyltransferase
MLIIRHHSDVPDTCRGSVVVIGNFDGVHRGHQAVVARAAAIADELRAPLGVIIFEPHPKEYFAPEKPPFRLMSFRDKARILERLGVDVLFVLSFDDQMANRLAQDFVIDVLVEGIGAVHVVVGYDYAFGKGRTGNTSVLSWMGMMEGFGVTIVDPIALNREAGNDRSEVFSSTQIRKYLGDGKMRAAADLLGHWWSVEGRVLKGDQRGRTIGFPTANVSLENYIVPRLGVYAVRVEFEDRDAQGAGGRSPLQTFDGVANVGKRPTFDKEDILLETHLFGYKGDLYGRHIRVSFIQFIRPEQKFDGLESLKAQIAADGLRARAILDEVRKDLTAYGEGLDSIGGHNNAT